MTLLSMEGFDHLTNTQYRYSKKGRWTHDYNNVDVLYGRFGGRGNNMGTSSAFSRYTPKVNKTTLVVGCAYKIYEEGVFTYSLIQPTIAFFDEVMTRQVAIYANSLNGIDARNGDGTLLGSSADDIINTRRWFYLEVKATISDTVGVVVVKHNGDEILNLTNQDTKNGTDYIRNVDVAITYNLDVLVDDIYIDDADFHGDCTVKTFFPDLDGNSADFTRSAGSNDYECVDDDPSNEDTDYISSNTLNHKSIFGITTGALGTVKGIQVNNQVRDDDVGTRKITPILRSNGTDYSGTETDQIAADYETISEVWELDPDDSGAWDQTKLEAAEFGLEITT